jgi:hypothetical protein
MQFSPKVTRLKWLFGIGVAVEAAGAILIVYPILRPIVVRSRRDELDELVVAAKEPVAYTLVGAVLLACGFVTQLGGYIWEFRGPWYYVAGTLTVLGLTFVLGSVVAGGWLTGWLERAARARQ